jgi:kynurenine 3-monooxygenase
LTDAIFEFSNFRTPDIATLVRVSHGLDRPGIAGVVNFLIPIILDGIFQKLAPQIFAPNVISMIQKEEITFQQAVQRKRLDRLGQLCLLGTALVVVVTGTQLLLEQIFG